MTNRHLVKGPKRHGHMKEHLKHEINTDKDLSPEEMEFHYFRLHDTNNDTMLDGLELLKALSHMMPPGMEVMPHETQGKTPADIEKLRRDRVFQMLNGFVMLVDKVLESDDVDKDGYLTYPEYIVARRRDAKTMMKAQQQMLKQAEAFKQQQAAMANAPRNTGL
nr:hypothetical protein BaRGS_026292 [Batillaria attramentaria]